jgi:hypothetical protein
MNLNDQLLILKRKGCWPSVYCRGNLWRAHVNVAGNYWADADTPEKALFNAVELWQKKGRPMDGLADN